MTDADIVIERCVLRVRRRGGWSWGPRPQDLAPALARAVADLVAARVAADYADALAAGHDVEITEPVTLVVPIRLSAVGLTSDDDHAAAPTLAVGFAPFETERSGPAPRAIMQLPVRVTAVQPHLTLSRLLGLLQADRGLTHLLDLLPARTLHHYAAVLAGTAPASSHPLAGSPLGLTAGPTSFLAAAPSTAAGAPVLEPPDLVPATGSPPVSSAGTPSTVLPPSVSPHVAAQVSAGPSTATPSSVAPSSATPPARLMPADSPETARQFLTDAAALAAGAPDELGLLAALTDHFGPAPAAAATPDDPYLGVVEVRSALPFLVAAALARIGVLAHIGAALVGAGLAADVPAFAVALAHQVLGPLERGWRRPLSDHADAAAFAARHPDLPDPDLAAVAHRAAPALPLVDALLAHAVATGHEPGRPLAVLPVPPAHGGGLLLAEADGAFPLIWTGNPAGLLPPWRLAGHPPMILTDTVPPATIRTLTDAGVPLCAPFPPTRGERWHRLPARRLWATTPGAAPPPALDIADLAETLTTQMAAAATRAALPAALRAVALPDFSGADQLALQRTVTLAAGLGLATVSWLLWHDREPTDASLAIERMGDLSATVTFTPDRVHVRLPLGRRHADLNRSGLLADVPDAFWPAGRHLSFSGG